MTSNIPVRSEQSNITNIMKQNYTEYYINEQLTIYDDRLNVSFGTHFFLEETMMKYN